MFSNSGPSDSLYPSPRKDYSEEIMCHLALKDGYKLMGREFQAVRRKLTKSWKRPVWGVSENPPGETKGVHRKKREMSSKALVRS